MSLAEDQEGDIWVGTARGIDRVRGARHALAHAERVTGAADERRLAGAQLARDGDDVTDDEASGEVGGERFRLLG